jgi:hypothetical protein
MSARNITYDGNGMQTDHIFTQDIDDASDPSKNAKMFPKGHYNGSSIPNINYPDKKIPVSGTIIGDNVADLDLRIDAFKAFFNGQDRNLDIDYAGSTRRYIATANTVTIKRPGGFLYANFSIEFECTQPFGQDVNTTAAASATGVTTATASYVYTFLGSSPVQRTVATITLTAVSSAGSQTMSFGNNNNGQQITVTRSTWATGDVVQVDSVLKQVTVNGIVVDYIGSFPEFKPGSGSMGYSDSFTSRTYNISVVYNVLYK